MTTGPNSEPNLGTVPDADLTEFQLRVGGLTRTGTRKLDARLVAFRELFTRLGITPPSDSEPEHE